MCFLFPSLSNPEGHRELTGPSPTPCDSSSALLAPAWAHRLPSAESHRPLFTPSLLPGSLVFALLLSKTKGTKCHYRYGRCWLGPSIPLLFPGGCSGKKQCWKKECFFGIQSKDCSASAPWELLQSC